MKIRVKVTWTWLQLSFDILTSLIRNFPLTLPLYEYVGLDFKCMLCCVNNRTLFCFTSGMTDGLKYLITYLLHGAESFLRS